MHGLTQSHVDYTTHWHPSSYWDTDKQTNKKSALACIHSEEIYCHFVQFQSGHMEDMVYRIRQGCEHSDTFALFKQMFYGEQSQFTIQGLLRVCHIITVCTTS